MRVIAGTAKGRRLKAPKGFDTRPTIDRVKEALFNILGQGILNTVFLDLYAGTGSIGIEAFSRGADYVAFVENSSKADRMLKDNLVATGFLELSDIYRMDVHKALDLLAKKGKSFDIIFLDPPYLKDLEYPVLENIQKNQLLKKDGIVIIESSARGQLPKTVVKLEMFREEKYGDTKISFYKIVDTQ